MDMEPEVYDRLVNQFGKQKADKIAEKYEQWQKENQKQLEREAKQQELRLAKMLPKEQLIDGAYYTGFRFRGAHVAQWDTRDNAFICIHYQFGYVIEKLPYFLDVEAGFDGFMPFEIIQKQ